MKSARSSSLEESIKANLGEGYQPPPQNPIQEAMLQTNQPPPTVAGIVQSADQLSGESPSGATDLAQKLPTPLRPYAKDFIEAGKEFKVDPALLASIAMHETGLGTSKAFKEGNNLMGISNRTGVVYYPDQNSATNSIKHMARLLGTSSIYKPYRDSHSIEELAKIYAPVGAENDPRGYNQHWASGVGKFLAQLTR